MERPSLPWSDGERLRELASSPAFDPLRGGLAPESLQTARLINERIMALAPLEYLPALRISRIHLAWAKASPTREQADYHYERRYLWLAEALLRDPPRGTRAVIESALAIDDRQGRSVRPSPDAVARARDALRDMAVTTVPDALVSLSRSLRQHDPRLPHLACIASYRAVAYADRGDHGDPAVAQERSKARSSLAAALRDMRRSTDAAVVAEEAVSLRPHSPVPWTGLVAATRDCDGPEAAIRVIADAVSKLGRSQAEGDTYFAVAAAAAYHQARRFTDAATWLAAALRNPEPRTLASRDEVSARARELVRVLRDRGQEAEAHELESLLDAASPVARAGAAVA